MERFDDVLTGPAGVEGYHRMVGWDLHIHFYGTDSFADVLADLAVLKAPLVYGNVKLKGVHYGFGQYAIRGMAIAQALIDAKAPERVILTGHSLGAAIAILVGIILHHMGVNVRADVCGAPRVGGLWLWWKARKVPIHRTEIDGDPVSQLPPWFFGYSHVGVVSPLPWRGKADIQSLYDRHQPAAYQPFVGYQL